MYEQKEKKKDSEIAEVETVSACSMQAENMAKKIVSVIKVITRCSPDVSAEIIGLIEKVREECNVYDIDLFNAFVDRLIILKEGRG